MAHVPYPARRAQRFNLGVTLRYRREGERRWHEAVTENISRSGVLFRAREVVAVDTPLEMRFTLSAGAISSDVSCRGRVVRTVLPERPRAGAGTAVTIRTYRFVRPRRTA
jgi:hypothetical protein